MGAFDSLMELQEIDVKLDALDDREKTLPERERAEKSSETVTAVEKAFKRDEEILHKEKLAQKKIEDEIKSITDKIQREQQRLYSGTVTNPKELSGMQQEIKSLEERRDEQETALLEQLEVVEPMEKEISVLSERLTELKKEATEAESAFAAVSAEITSARAGLKKERTAVLPDVPKDQLDTYEKARKRFRRAVVRIEDGLCQGCRTDIPTAELERIKSQPGLSKCPNCGRLLAKD